MHVVCGGLLGALMGLTVVSGNWVLFLVAAVLFMINLMALGWHHS